MLPASGLLLSQHIPAAWSLSGLGIPGGSDPLQRVANAQDAGVLSAVSAIN